MTRTNGLRWPTGTDYARAIQHAPTAFEDEVLRQSNASKNGMGLPVAATGQNAVVFLLGGVTENQAVRCFTTPPTDGRDRYNALSGHLAAVESTAIVASRWLDDGIRCDDNLFPVVVMPWVEGRPFNLLLDDLAADVHGLASMASAMAETL